MNRIQNLRKNAGFEVTDRIRIVLECPDEFAEAVSKLSDYIKSETLAIELSTTKKLDSGKHPDGYSEAVEIDKQKFNILVSRASKGV